MLTKYTKMTLEFKKIANGFKIEGIPYLDQICVFALGNDQDFLWKLFENY